MKNEDNEIESNYREIRIFLIGDYYVGKKSIASRFKILNSTITTQDYSNAPPNKPKKKQDDNKIKPKEEEDDQSFEEKELMRRQMKIRDLMSIGKVFTIGYHNLTFNFFPISEAIPIVDENDMREEDENYAFEKEYQITLKQTKSEIDSFMRKPGKNPKSDIDYVFLFIYDLKDYTSFEKIQIYYRELNKQFAIASNYSCALIGNKLDIKPLYGENEKNAISNFVAENNLKHYEISTLIFFNFENFFEILFNDLLSGLNEDFQSEIFKKRLHLMLTFRPSFGKAKRITFNSNDNPSSAEYNTDVYAYSDSKEEMKIMFDNSSKFTNRIFINKQGPIFPYIVKDLGYNKTQPKGKESGFNVVKQWDRQLSSEIKDILETMKPGYSLGLVAGKLNLKKERKEQRHKRFEALQDALDDDAHKLVRKLNKSQKNKDEYAKYSKNRRQSYLMKIENIVRIESEGKSKRDKILEENDNLRLKKIKEIKEKEEKYNEIKELKDQEVLNSRKKAAFKVSTSLKPNQSSTPGTQYDIRWKIDPRKGYTFGSRYNLDFNKSKDTPEFSNLKSDFDLIVERERDRPSKRNFAERFQTPAISEQKDPIDIMNKWKKWEEARKSNQQKNPWFETRRELQKIVDDNKKVLNSQREMELEVKIEQQKRKNNIDDYNNPIINYNQVEEQSPLFTMKGRYEIGGIFSGITKEKQNDYGDLNNQLANDLTKAALPLPKFNVVKPALPSFSFSKANRFDDGSSNEFGSTQSENAFANGIFVPDDRKTFSTLQATMGKSKKDNELKASWIPGPGYYKIKGFGEEVLENGLKINEARTRIREIEKSQKKKEGEEGTTDRKKPNNNEEVQYEPQEEENLANNNNQSDQNNTGSNEDNEDNMVIVNEVN